MATHKSKIDLSAALQSSEKVIIELGCGPQKQKGRIGIDALDLPGVDVVANLDNGLPFLPDHCVDEIHSSSLLEHIKNLELLMREMLRVLKPEGVIHCFVPHFSNPYFYSDYTHSRFFGYYTFFYFCDTEDQPTRKVPCFYHDIRIKITSIQLVFDSPFRGRQIFKRIFGNFVNWKQLLQEFYEENLCYFVPCYGIQVSFRPKENPN
jgi:SAM-dependent methyltransferase